MPNISVQNQGQPGLNVNENYNSMGYVPNASLNDSSLFLKMLTVSMANQDPMNPTDGNEFLNQMLQYATMETLTNVTRQVQELVNVSYTSNMYNVINSAISLTGKDVTVMIPKGTDDSEEDAYVSGVVDKVTMDEDGIWLEINGEKYEYDNLVSVHKEGYVGDGGDGESGTEPEGEPPNSQN